MNSGESGRDGDYVEAIVVLSSGGARDLAEKWFVERSFKTVPMRSGFLVIGDRAAVNRAFNVRIAGLSEHIDLPIPEELRGQVTSISIPKLPIYGNDTSTSKG
jgi:hypothetical protein